MSVETTKSTRRFSILELLIYVSLFAVTFAAFRLKDPPAPVGLASICLFGALIGIGIAALLTGRKHLMAGAIVGGIVLPSVLFVAFAIVVYRTHNRPRKVIVQPPGVGLKVQLHSVENDEEDSIRR